MRCSECIHDVSLSKSKGSHLNWLGMALKCFPNAGVGDCSDCEELSETGSKFWWLDDGNIRYNHDCWFSCRSAVKAVPESFSVYKPCGACCGEFCPIGSAPGTASLLQHVSLIRDHNSKLTLCMLQTHDCIRTFLSKRTGLQASSMFCSSTNVLMFRTEGRVSWISFKPN